MLCGNPIGSRLRHLDYLHCERVCDGAVEEIDSLRICVGITPMLQIIRHIFKDPQDLTDVSLLFANQVRQSRLFAGESYLVCIWWMLASDRHC